MDPETGTLQAIAQHLVLALQPLKEGVADLAGFRTLMYRLAWHVESLPPEYAALAAKVDEALTALDQLGDDPSASDILAVIDKVNGLYTTIQNITTAPAGVDPAAFLGEIGRSLFDLLIIDYLVDQFPSAHSMGLALGIIKQEFTEETSTRPAVLISRIEWAEIPNVLGDPGSIPARLYGWGTNDLDFHRLAGHLLEFFVALDWPAYIGRVDEAMGKGFLDAPDDAATRIEWGLKMPVLLENIGGQEVEIGAALLELPPQGAKPAGLILQPLVPSQVGSSLQLTDTIRLEMRAGTNAGTTLGVLLRPDDISVKFPLQEGAALLEAGFGMTLRYAPESPAMLLGTPGRSRLELKGASTSVEVDLRAGEADLRLQIAPDDLKLIIAATDLDGFLGELFGNGDKAIPIVLGAQWSKRTGFNFTGGAGLEISTHPHLSLGPVRIDRLDLGIKSTFGSGQPPDLTVQVGTVVAGVIGPVSLSADGLGVTLSLTFADGNAGPFDIDYGFTPPKGLGIAVDAGPIAGGGFLSFDREKGRYAGALELEVFAWSVKAVGFVETKLPNGAPGYSFVILIATEFTPIQLGLGFTLNGVGGLVALHRRLDVEALRSSMLAGSVDDILYPRDPIADAPRIISQLGVIFPAARNHFVFAPTALIGWGTPTLIRAEVGVVFEPSSAFRLTLLGLISAALPTEDTAIVELHVAVLGKIDLARLRLAIDATLYDSKVAGFPLTGDMALRLTWGVPPSIVVSLGGLNPHFEPPADFPTLERLTIVLGRGDNPRLTCQAYLAITSNTRQFGVRAELYAAAAGFNIRGWVNFDCLIQLFPFSFLAELSADVAFRRGQRVLASVHLEATVTGPVPWHVWGEASLSLWFLDVTVGFDVTIGPELVLQLPLANPWPLLQAAIQDLRNWSSTVPGAHAVTLRAVKGPDVPVLMDPGGAATLRQTVVPLNRRITRFGAAKPEGPDRYTVSGVRMNSAPPQAAPPVTEYFAAAQFDDLSDTEQLSRPSFERMDAGLRAGDAVTTGASVGAKVEYETIILDAPWQRRVGPRYALLQDLQLVMVQLGASAQAPFKTSGLNKFGSAKTTPSRVSIDEDRFVVASTADATAVPGLTATGSKGAVLAMLADHLKAHPEDKDRLQVVPEDELVSIP